MNSLTTALQGKMAAPRRKNPALRGKKGRTSREKAPHFEGKKDGVTPVNTDIFQHPHDIN